MRARQTRQKTQTNDNFIAMRLFAVLMVIYGNGFILIGSLLPPACGVSPSLRSGCIYYSPPVDFHRPMSGCVIRIGVAFFAARRASRLLPGLVVTLLLTVLVIGPVATKLSMRQYFLNGQTVQYFANLLLIQQRMLPGVFEGQQWGGLGKSDALDPPGG